MTKPFGHYAMTADEVAEKLFLHPKSIHDIEQRALAKMRKLFDERGIKVDDLLPE